MYRRRTIEDSIREVNDFFPVLLISGARQVGKTTVLRTICGKARKYVSLDTPAMRSLARNEPELFIKRFAPPVLIDEIQYAPELFSFIKSEVDMRGGTGLYWLTGSQPFQLMKAVSDSLAGRVGLLHLCGFSQEEELDRKRGVPFLPDSEWVADADGQSALDETAIFRRIWQGAFPRVRGASNRMWGIFYESYVQTYLERDIRALKTISDEQTFLKFLCVAASRTGQLLDISGIARDVGISQPTAKAWISLLVTSGLATLLQPFSNNIGNRFIKTPKLHFLDTGLACHLTGWKTDETVRDGAMAGHLLESYVVAEILKSYWHRAENPRLSYYRTKDGAEIDLLIERDGLVYPVEIKKSANPSKHDISAFAHLDRLGVKRGDGCALALASEICPLTDRDNVIPIGLL